MTLQEVKKKYKNRYISFCRSWDYSNDRYNYDNIKSFNVIHENTTRACNLETNSEYRD